MTDKNTDLLKMAKIIDEAWEETRVLGLTPPPISTVKLLERVEKEARADERSRVVGEIENLDRHSDSRCAELECSEDGYTNGLDDVLALIRAELTNKD